MTTIDSINYPVPKQEYKVLVRCMTYNQSNYIEDALNGFSMQQTNFPFVCLVMDDASTDGEQDVINAWMERECDMSRAETIDISTSVVIIVPHMTNNSCTFAFYFLKQNLYGTGKKLFYINPWREKCDYEAICEGDDYWTDPLKLQKQVDIIDSDDKIGLVWCKSKLYNQTTGKFVKEIGSNSNCIYSFLEYNHVPTQTVLYKSLLYKEFNLIKRDKWKMGDFPLWLYIYGKAKIFFLDEVVAVYRCLEESASHSRHISKQISFLNSFYEIQKFYVDKYNIPWLVSMWYKFRHYYTKLKLYVAAKIYHKSLIILFILPLYFILGIVGCIKIRKKINTQC